MPTDDDEDKRPPRNIFEKILIGMAIFVIAAALLIQLYYFLQ